MINSTQYESFENYILRAPLFNVDFFKDLTSENYVSNLSFLNLLKDPIIKEAIFLATPILYTELEKWSSGELRDVKKIDKLKNSLLKYISRMCSRCTPFGLFAGCNVGKLNNDTDIKLNDVSEFKRHTRLDMNYLVALSQDLSQDKNIKEQLLFFPNTSIYKLSQHIRYVEYEYLNAVRNHHIVGVDYSIYLEKALKYAEDGILYEDLIDLLIDEEYAFDVVKDFVDDLISSQVFISELEPSVSGPDFLQYIISVLAKLNNTERELNILLDVKNKLASIDEKIGNLPDLYIDISEILGLLNTTFDIKYLFQTDLILTSSSNFISYDNIEKIKQGLVFLNKITPFPKETSLNQFKEAFVERYEEREISLEKVLDVESGIGYRQNQNILDINPLIDDLFISSKNTTNEQKDIRWSSFNSLFQEKLLYSYANKDQKIIFKDEDISKFKENWDDLPDTISCWTEILIIDGKEKILLGSCGGSSAANVLARFCHADKAIHEYVQKIVNYEESLCENKILAEIIHLPEARIGNVLMRPAFRKFEIPYLAKSTLTTQNQIKIRDLVLSVKNGKLNLRSKKLGSQLVDPRLTNAHNYNNNNSLPIYQFLSEMQTQNKRSSISLYLGPHLNDYFYIPRIEYKDLILSEALWNIKTRDIMTLYDVLDNGSELLVKVNILRNKFRIPQFILLIQSDHELLVNLENISTLKMLLGTVKNSVIFQIKEFLYSESGIVQNEDVKKHFTNQIIFSFYKPAHAE